MKIIRERERVTQKEYYLSYEDGKGSGYSFTCTENGGLLGLKSQAAIENFIACITGEDSTVEYNGIQCYSWNYTEEAIGICDCCGEHVHLSRFTNTCECGADYNMSGQRLADRSQWGEETGEHWTDCY